MANQKSNRSIVLEVDKSLDSSNCQTLIEKVSHAYEQGNGRVVVDLQHTNTVSSCGFEALYTIVTASAPQGSTYLESWGLKFLSPQSRWRKSRAVLIRNPQPHVAQALFSLGFGHYADIQTAV